MITPINFIKKQSINSYTMPIFSTLGALLLMLVFFITIEYKLFVQYQLLSTQIQELNNQKIALNITPTHNQPITTFNRVTKHKDIPKNPLSIFTTLSTCCKDHIMIHDFRQDKQQFSLSASSNSLEHSLRFLRKLQEHDLVIQTSLASVSPTQSTEYLQQFMFSVSGTLDIE